MARQAFNFEHQPLNAPIDSAQHIPSQCSPCIYLHHLCILITSIFWELWVVLHNSLFQVAAKLSLLPSEVSQPNVSTKDQLSFDSSAYLKRVSVPRVSGNKKDVEGWKAAFMSCVHKAGAFLEYKLLHFRECLQGETLKVVENLGHSAAAYEAAKTSSERRALALRMEELQEENKKDLESFAELLDAVVVTLVDDAGQAGELGGGSLYIMLQRKLNKGLLVKYKQWVTENGRTGNIQYLRKFINRESEFLTTVSEIITDIKKAVPSKKSGVDRPL